MNFDDTPQEAAFRAEAKAWIAANAPKQYEEELRKSSLGRTQLKGANILEVAKAWQKKKADAGWACLHWPKEYGGRGATPIERVIWQQEEGAFGKLSRHVHHRPRHVRADHDGVCRRGAEAQLSAAAGLGRKDLVPAVLRTRRRIRRRGPAHPRGEAAATTGSSTARRSGPRARIIPTTASCSPAPIPTCPSTRASPCSSWT